mgnify:CR=1 FL=1
MGDFGDIDKDCSLKLINESLFNLESSIMYHCSALNYPHELQDMDWHKRQLCIHLNSYLIFIRFKILKKHC